MSIDRTKIGIMFLQFSQKEAIENQLLPSGKNSKNIIAFANDYNDTPNSILVFSEKEISAHSSIEIRNFAMITGKLGKTSMGIISLKEKKYKGIINIYTSIIFDYRMKEIRICNDSGRLTRPVLRVKDKNILLDNDIISKIKEMNGKHKGTYLFRVQVFIHPLEASGTYIRVRDEGFRTTMTYKLKDPKSKFENEEEIQINDFDAAVNILLGVGCKKKYYYEKIREIWTIKNTEIVE